MGLERLAMVAQGTETIFETDLFSNIMRAAPEWLSVRQQRVVVDHLRAACFLIADTVRPDNKGAGYVLRRLVRRAVTLTRTFDLSNILSAVVRDYKPFYAELDEGIIKQVFQEERAKFELTLERGIKEIEKQEQIDATKAFELFSTHGIPYEAIKDLGGEKSAGLSREDFEKEFSKHQEVSKGGLEQKFAGGLIDYSPETIKHHTATHLLNAALRKVLGPHVWQKGSNVSRDRTRFDFTHPEKMTDTQIEAVERLVNEWIQKDLLVLREEMSREEAGKLGAIGVFGEKYPDRVSIYTITDRNGQVVSREFCGGPHVERTGGLGRFKIQKEESSSAGVRRIKAALRPVV
jgi:alanyl-tRNA synthetase